MKNGELLRTRAQALRKNATAEENHLWYDFLRIYPVQFRRQVPLGRYIVDFFCAGAKLAVELDWTDLSITKETARNTTGSARGIWRRTGACWSFGLPTLRYGRTLKGCVPPLIGRRRKGSPHQSACG